MNHLKPKTVRAGTRGFGVFLTVPFEFIVEQGYSEEDLDVNGDLVLSDKVLEKFINAAIKRAKKAIDNVKEGCPKNTKCNDCPNEIDCEARYDGDF